MLVATVHANIIFEQKKEEKKTIRIPTNIDDAPMATNGMDDVRHVVGRRKRQSLVAPLFQINSTKNRDRKMYRLMLTIVDAEGSRARRP